MKSKVGIWDHVLVVLPLVHIDLGFCAGHGNLTIESFALDMQPFLDIDFAK